MYDTLTYLTLSSSYHPSNITRRHYVFLPDQLPMHFIFSYDRYYTHRELFVSNDELQLNYNYYKY